MIKSSISFSADLIVMHVGVYLLRALGPWKCWDYDYAWVFSAISVLT